MNKYRAGLTGLLLTAPFALAMQAAHERPVPAAKVTVRIVVFTESDGSNPAASHKQIDQQFALLRADGAKHGLHFVMKATTFVADSARRHADANALVKNAGKHDHDFPPSQAEMVIYVTGLRSSGATPIMLRSSADTSMQPAIVIDSSEFGGQGCGAGKDKPCRALSLALADGMTAQTAIPGLRVAAENLKQEILQAGQD